MRWGVLAFDDLLADRLKSRVRRLLLLFQFSELFDAEFILRC